MNDQSSPCDIIGKQPHAPIFNVCITLAAHNSEIKFFPCKSTSLYQVEIMMLTL